MTIKQTFSLLTLSPWERVAMFPERSAALSYAEVSKEPRPGEVKKRKMAFPKER
jgi:hypothetical protein